MAGPSVSELFTNEVRYKKGRVTTNEARNTGRSFTTGWGDRSGYNRRWKMIGRDRDVVPRYVRKDLLI